MRSILCRAGAGSWLMVAAVALVGCSTSQSGNGGGSPSSAKQAKQGQAAVQEAKTMEKHGQQLQAQGDDVGGNRLIEQARVKEAQGEAAMEKAQKPTTRPQ